MSSAPVRASEPRAMLPVAVLRRISRPRKAAVAKKYGGAEIASPLKALELIAAAQSNTYSQGFDAEDQALAELVMTDALRASLYSFNLIQKKRTSSYPPRAALSRQLAARLASSFS